MSVGFRIFTQRPLPDPELVRAVERSPRLRSRMPCTGCAMTPDVRLLSDPVGTMSGVALTVKARPGDSLMIHKALNMAEEGDVLIVSGGGIGAFLMGELMFRYAASKNSPGLWSTARSGMRIACAVFRCPCMPRDLRRADHTAKAGRNQRPVVCCGQVWSPGTSSSGTATASSSSRREMRPVCTTRRGNPMSGIWRRPRNARRGLSIVDG